LLFVGDDWAEAHHDVEVMDATGRRLVKARLPEGVAGMARLGTHALSIRSRCEVSDSGGVDRAAAGLASEGRQRQMRVLLWVCRRLHCGRWLPLVLAAWQRAQPGVVCSSSCHPAWLGHPLMRVRRATRRLRFDRRWVS
jgi:hypothetical protein